MPVFEDFVPYYGDGLYGAGAYMEAVSQGIETAKTQKALRPLPPPVVSGMRLQGDVVLGNLVLNTIDANNVIWVCTDIEGWWVHPDPEMTDIPRGFGDGSYDVRGRWAARQITLRGSILPPNSDYLPAARDTLIAATSLVYSGDWLVVHESPHKASYVRLSGRPTIQTVNARGRTDFEIGLRAADPIKYEWDSTDPEGYSSTTIPCKNTATSATGNATITNDGNIKVSAIFEVTGPALATTANPCTIYNVDTDEIITITQTLRAGETRSITNKVLTSNVATLTTSASHTLVAGDIVTVTGTGVTPAFNGVHEVTSVPTSTTFTYELIADNVASAAAAGTAVRAADVLEIDTFDHSVAFNGLTGGARTYVDTLVDWIELGPGANAIQFRDEATANSTASLKVYYRSGWIG